MFALQINHMSSQRMIFDEKYFRSRVQALHVLFTLFLAFRFPFLFFLGFLDLFDERFLEINNYFLGILNILASLENK